MSDLPPHLFDGQWEATRSWTYPRVIAGKVYPCARLTTGDVWIIDEDGEQAAVTEWTPLRLGPKMPQPFLRVGSFCLAL